MPKEELSNKMPLLHDNEQAALEKAWENIGISDDFMFGKLMQSPDLCKKLLQRIFPDVPIDHIEYPELQKTINPDPYAKGVRLDVYVTGDEKIFDVEMQTVLNRNLPMRSRYYSSLIDMQALDKGEDYEKLPESFVIFICLKDPYIYGLHFYSFQRLSCQMNGLKLNDSKRFVKGFSP